MGVGQGRPFREPGQEVVAAAKISVEILSFWPAELGTGAPAIQRV